MDFVIKVKNNSGGTGDLKWQCVVNCQTFYLLLL